MPKRNFAIQKGKIIRAEVLRCAQNDKKTEWLGKSRVTKIFRVVRK